MAKACPKCGQELNIDGFCEKCGKNIFVYKKAANTSKMLYNQGLQMAKLRDLTGAISSLKRSIKFDKNNIDARNLLGLIYFEIGETVSALQQWVISKNIEPNGNIAERYLEIVQQNQNHLDKLNTAIKNYNKSLQHIKQKSVDLAIIQLKKVISLNPRFIKAYCLLALCYMKEAEYSKADKIIKRILLIDRNHYVARKYDESLKDILIDKNSSENVDKLNQKKNINRIPVSSSLQQLILVVVGLFVGLAVALFLILPNQIGKKETKIETVSQELTTKETELEQTQLLLSEEIKKTAEYEDTNLKLNEELSSLKDTFNESTKILTALQYYGSDEAGNLLATANELYIVDHSKIEGTPLSEIYNALKNEVYPVVAKAAYIQGYNYYAYYGKDYRDDAIEQFNISLKFVKDADYSSKALYFRGLVYYNDGDYDNALKDFKTIVDEYPDAKYYGDAEWWIGELE